MKKHLFIISIIILTGIILISTATTKPNKRINSATTSSYHQDETLYVLKDYKGRIALFHQNEEKPVEVYDVFTNSLPEDDAQQIKRGITVSTDELNNLLSDYIS